MKLIEKKGFKFFCRPNPGYDDEYTVGEILDSDVYGLRQEHIKDGVIVDIGANIGAFCIPASRFGKVIAYEPSPANFEVLKMNIAINDANVEAYNCAVGKRGQDTIENENSGHSRIGEAGGEGSTVVDVISFDDIPFEICDFLKMDCEGGEYNVIKYASDEKLSKVNRIVGELHSWLFEDKDYEIPHREMIVKLEKFFTLSYDGFKNSNMKGEKKMTDQKGQIYIDGIKK